MNRFTRAWNVLSDFVNLGWYDRLRASHPRLATAVAGSTVVLVFGLFAWYHADPNHPIYTKYSSVPMDQAGHVRGTIVFAAISLTAAVITFIMIVSETGQSQNTPAQTQPSDMLRPRAQHKKLSRSARQRKHRSR